MHRIVIIALAIFSVAVHAADQPLPAALAGLADAEREFAAAGLRDGIQKSFLAHFSDDAVVLVPLAKPAPDWYRAHPDRPGRLIWGPQYLAVSAAGDLGLSSGPWRAESERDGKPVVAHGHFFSVWRRNAQGHWQVIFDHGISHDATAQRVEGTPLVALGKPEPKAALAAKALDQRRQDLTRADDALRERLAKDSQSAYAPVAGADVLWLREGTQPQIASLPTAANAKAACGCGPRASVGVAASGDLGYTIGGADGARERGADVRVWRYGADGWKLLADLSVAAD